MQPNEHADTLVEQTSQTRQGDVLGELEAQRINIDTRGAEVERQVFDGEARIDQEAHKSASQAAVENTLNDLSGVPDERELLDRQDRRERAEREAYNNTYGRGGRR